MLRDPEASLYCPQEGESKTKELHKILLRHGAIKGRTHGRSGGRGEMWQKSRKGTGIKYSNLSLFPYWSLLLMPPIG